MSDTPQPTATGPDDIDAVIRTFAEGGNVLPESAMRWALDNWDVAAPRFVGLLSRYADGADRTEATMYALFFAIHLLGEKRESTAFVPLCRLLLDDEAAADVLYDAVTENLNGILINTFDGDPAPLQRVIESADADEFVRIAALEAMSYLTRIGALADTEMRAYLLHLRAEMQPREESFIWTTWAFGAANLGYGDFAGEVASLIDQGFIDRNEVNLDDFRKQVELTWSDPSGMAGFAAEQIVPFGEAIATLSTWYGFSEEYRRLEEPYPEESAEPSLATLMASSFGEPFVNPMRHVGRNDPCPCGSGRKYKKCCGA